MTMERHWRSVGDFMESRLRRPARPSRRAACAVVLLLALSVLAGGVAVAPPRPAEAGLRDSSSPCADIAASYPVLANDTTEHPEAARMFRVVCGIPEFLSLLREWGVANFSFGWMGVGPNPAEEVVTNYTYGVTWVSACTDPAYMGSFRSCTHEEYWVGNVTTETVTGPFLTESGTTYMGPEVPSPLPTLLYVLVALCAGTILGGLVVRIRRARRGGDEG